jgi:hypothetical protein
VEEIYGEHLVEVALLRNVRDNVMSTTPEGKEVIRVYYELSPVILTMIKNDE